MEGPALRNPYAAPLTDVREPEQVATEKGRRLVLAVISTIVAFSVFPGVLSAALDSHVSALTVARVSASLVLCVFLYRRANWARVVGGSVLGLAGIGSILTGLVRSAMDSTSIALIAFGTIYVSVATVLLFIPAVRAYFEPEQNDARWFAVVGLVFQCALIIGLLHFAILAVLALQAIIATGSSDPRILAEALGQAMIPLVLWGAAGVLGLSATVATLIFSKYRARWFYRCSWAFAVLYLLFVPVGTLIALALIAVLVIKRREFPRARASVA
jgi:hypothetical protein